MKAPQPVPIRADDASRLFLARTMAPRRGPTVDTVTLAKKVATISRGGVFYLLAGLAAGGNVMVWRAPFAAGEPGRR